MTATFTKLPDTIATRYYHTDVIGSARAITDEAGATVESHDYRPLIASERRERVDGAERGRGAPRATSRGVRRGEAPRIEFDARYYRNTWGRFTTVDPVHVEAAMLDPQQWNRYAYA